MNAVTHKGVMRFTIQNFTAGRKNTIVSLNEALQTERGEAGLKNNLKRRNATTEGMPWTETKLQGKSTQACFVIGCLSFSCAAYSPSNETTHSESITQLHLEEPASEKYCKLDIKKITNH